MEITATTKLPGTPKVRFSEENPPKSILQAEEQIQLLIQDSQDIQTQLGERRPIARMSDEDYKAYCQWKNQAMRTKDAIDKQIRFLKLWVKKQEESSDIHTTRNGYARVRYNPADIYALTKEQEIVFKKFSKDDDLNNISSFRNILSLHVITLREIEREKMAIGLDSPEVIKSLRKALFLGYHAFYILETKSIFIESVEKKVKEKTIEFIFLYFTGWDLNSLNH